MDHTSFWSLVLLGTVALFPPVNPVGKAFFVDSLMQDLSAVERKIAAFKVALYCFLLCIGTLLVGNWIFHLFGISLPVVQVAGGIMICKMGWELLSDEQKKPTLHESAKVPDAMARIEDQLFFPIAFPTTTGAGTISVLFTLSMQERQEFSVSYVERLSALGVSVFLICLLLFFCYAYTPQLTRKLGPHGAQMLNRLCAFLVFCVGLQIASTGLQQLFK